MKKLLFTVLIFSMICSCGSTKPPEGETIVEIPCTGKDYKSDKKSYRASGNASANATAGAIKAARRKAEGKLIVDIKSSIDLVSEQYEEIIEDGEIGEYTASTEEFSRKVASGTLQNIKVICEKTTRVASTGMYKHYISLEMSVDDVLDDYIASISNSKKKNIRVNRDKMRAIFDEVMSK